MKKQVLQVSIAILIFSSCVNLNEQQNMIHFFVKYASPIVKSSFSSFTNGYTALIYTYTNGSLSEIFTGAPLSATSQNGGYLYPTTPLKLPNGCYDFYSVSNNSTESVSLNFTNGISDNLSNGVDYLWAGNIAETITNGANVAFAYYHLACLVNIYIIPSINVGNLYINYIRYSLPSNNGIVMNISCGTINSATSTTDLTIVPGVGYTRSFICLPYTAQTQIEVSLDATIDGENVFNRLYNANIDMPFVSGNSYDIILNLNTNSSFAVFVSVAPWQTDYLTITY